jgi:chromosome segregation protein
MPTGRCWNPPPPIWPQRNTSWRCPSRKPQPQPPRWLNSNTSRKNRASPSLTQCRRPRGFATNSRKPKSASQERTAKHAVCKLKSTNANLQVEAFGGQRGQLALEFETVTQRVAGITEEISQLRRLVEAKRLEETKAKTHLDLLRAEFATALGKKGSLEAVIAEHGYSTESVRRLFQSGVMQSGLAPVGVLADFLEVEPRFERVVEDFLRDELNYIVVKSWDAADEGLRLLRSDVDGRATFLVHPEDSQAKFSFILDEAAHCAPPTASIVPLKHTIRVLDGFGKSLEVILPKLRDGYIVPGSDTARGLALENPDAFFLSQSGECFHNVTVTGGKQRAEGPLSMKRELREVLRQLEDLERALAKKRCGCSLSAGKLKTSLPLLERLEGEKREAEHQSMTSGHMLQQLDSEMARVTERMGISQAELRNALLPNEPSRNRSSRASGGNRRGGTKSRSTRAANRVSPGISRCPATASRRCGAKPVHSAWPGSRHWKSAIALRLLCSDASTLCSAK